MADKEYILREPRNTESLILNSCCCCVPLKTGCLILGYLQLVLYVLAGILAIAGIVGGLALLYSVKNIEQDRGFVLLIVSVVLILTCLFTLPFTIVLLVGLHKDNRKYIKVYLIYSVITLSIYIVATLARYNLGYLTSLAGIGIALNIYYILVIRSHYIKLGWENNSRMDYYGGQVITPKAKFLL